MDSPYYISQRICKIKKSEQPACGTNEIYIPNWKFCNDCTFLKEVAVSRPTYSNIAPSNNLNNDDEHMLDVDTLETPNKDIWKSVA